MTPLDLGDRFWSKVQPADALECWRWTAATNGNGYGSYYFNGHSRGAHRIAYEAFIGDIPEGLVLDHLCRVRSCVNPWHLDVVTHQVNIIRGVGPERAAQKHRSKTHCPTGHAYAAENTLIDKYGHRVCLACIDARRDLKNARLRLKYAAQRAAKEASQ